MALFSTRRERALCDSTGAVSARLTRSFVNGCLGAARRPACRFVIRPGRAISSRPDDSSVRAWNSGLLAFELAARLKRLSGWPLIVARNHWFQHKVVAFFLSSEPRTIPRTNLFSYSYARAKLSASPNRVAGRTVLGQIDPGPFEEEIVAAEAEKEPSLAPNWRRAPAAYWKSWREECDAADRIIVNSQWSFDAWCNWEFQRRSC